MSKDIRSFFTVLSKKTGSTLNNPKPKKLTQIDSDDEDVIENTPEKHQKKTSLKRRVQILSSDSEEEGPSSTSLTKKSKNALKPQKDSKTTLKLINLDSLEKPIEQSKVKYIAKPVEESKDSKAAKAKKRSKKGKPSEISVHDDKDFTKTLEDLDDSNDTILLDNLDFLDKTIEEAKESSDSNENDHNLSETQPKQNKSSKSINANKERNSSDDKTPKKSAKRARKLSESTPSSKKQKLELTDSGVDPDFEKTQRKKHSTELYISYLHRAGPKHHGEKEYPKGKPDCLKGITFLRTGVLDSLEGEEFGKLVNDHGGRVVHSVSKKINYVVLGDEPGPAKLEKTRRYNIPEITENQFLDMILVKSGEKPRYAVLKSESEDWGLGSSEDSSVKTDEIFAMNEDNKDADNTILYKKTVSKPLSSEKAPKEESNTKKPLVEARKEFKEISTSSGYTNTQIQSTIPHENLSWTDKYKPTNLKGIIGQQDSNSNMYKLKKWLENWFKNADPERRKTLPKPNLYNQHDGAYFKAALLSGPPGVGKTTTATLVSKELGFDIVEFNASDTRNKKLLHEEISHMMRSKTVAGFVSGRKNINQKRVLLMDEVDGMAGNEDRGGIAELINFIKTASFPIICMCNNRELPKMRTLVNHCYALKFGKPNVIQVRGAMMSICFKEGLTIKPETLAQLITGTGNDIRQTLTHLAMWSAAEKNLSPETVQKESKNSQKDVVFGVWDVIRKVFNKSENKDMTLADKARLFFYDYSFGPLFVQENYLTVNPECTGPKAMQPIETLIRRHLTADSLSESDIIERKIRSTNNWSLLDSQAYFSTVLPSHYLSGTMGQVRFPSWFGRNSQRNKSLRIVGEIYTHSRTAISGDKLSVRLDYVEHLKNRLLHPLIQRQTAGIDDTLGVMKAYSLLRDDLTNICDLISGLAMNHVNPFDSVNSSVKAALTRKYNKVMVLSIAPPTAAKKKKSSKLEQENVFDEDEESSDGDQDEDNVDDDGLIKQVKAPKAGSSKAAAPEKGRKRGKTNKTNEKKTKK